MSAQTAGGLVKNKQGKTFKMSQGESLENQDSSCQTHKLLQQRAAAVTS